jgi:hypothetical protein
MESTEALVTNTAMRNANTKPIGDTHHPVNN